MSRKKLSFDQIEHEAQQYLSSFNGDNGYSNFGGADDPRDEYPYDGFDDDDLDFGGQGINFASEMANERQFQMILSNENAAAQTVILCPSYSPTNANRVIRDGAIPYAVGATDLIAAGSPGTIAEFLEFIKQNPTRSVQFQFETNNSASLSQNMTMQHKAPWMKASGIQQINLSNNRTEFASNDKLITVKRQTQFDHQTEIILTMAPRVAAGTPTTVTITWFIGGVYNIAKSLHKKFSRAVQESPQVRTNLIQTGSKMIGAPGAGV